jgi:tetratricopeptide (TPR) repeat protein
MLLAACGPAGDRAAEKALRQGALHFRNAEFEAAAAAFADAPLDARAIYDHGLAAFRLKRWSEAAERFRAAAATDTAAIDRAGDQYNLGTAMLAASIAADSLSSAHRAALAGIRIEGNDIAEKVAHYVLRDSLMREGIRLESLIDSSLAAAEGALRLALRGAPADEDARWNLALAQRFRAAREKARKEQRKGGKDKDADEALTARAQLIMQRADSLVEAYRFQEALDLMQGGLRQDPSLRSKKEYMDKLQLVTKAATAR